MANMYFETPLYLRKPKGKKISKNVMALLGRAR